MRVSKSPCFTSASPPGGSPAPPLPCLRVTPLLLARVWSQAEPAAAHAVLRRLRPLVPLGPSRRRWRGGQCVSRGGWGLLSDQESPETTGLKTKGLHPRGLFNTRAARGLCTFRNKKVILYRKGGWLIAQLVKNLPAMRETWALSLGWEDPLAKGKATHSSMLAWRISWTV